MNRIDLFQDLLEKAENLPLRDEEKLDALKRRTEMIIRNIFGNSSEYLSDLNQISFYHGFTRTSIESQNRMWITGQKKFINLLETILEEIELFQENNQNEDDLATEFSNKIFVVHGHDEEMKQSVARNLEKLDLDPIILHEQPNHGKTIIEKFTDYSDVSFAAVLLSPDDFGYSKSEGYENAKSRARQNVILELGFFLGKLGRERVFVLYKEDENFEMPSDYNGVLYIPYDNGNGWKHGLVRELKACGYDIDANKLF